MQALTSSSVFVFTFHGLGSPGRRIEAGEEEYWLDPGFFESALGLIPPGTNTRITFDDANESDFTIALPLLLKHGLSATFFLVSERLERPGFLSKAQAVALHQAGMKIGSHGLMHRQWARLVRPELHRELHESKAQLEALIGEGIHEAACPFGSYNRRVVKAAKQAGYERIHTSDGGPASGTAFVGARNTIRRSHTLGDVRRKVSEAPAGGSSLLRSLKLFIKRWR